MKQTAPPFDWYKLAMQYTTAASSLGSVSISQTMNELEWVWKDAYFQFLCFCQTVSQNKLLKNITEIPKSVIICFYLQNSTDCAIYLSLSLLLPDRV